VAGRSQNDPGQGVDRAGRRAEGKYPGAGSQNDWGQGFALIRRSACRFLNGWARSGGDKRLIGCLVRCTMGGGVGMEATGQKLDVVPDGAFDG